MTSLNRILALTGQTPQRMGRQPPPSFPTREERTLERLTRTIAERTFEVLELQKQGVRIQESDLDFIRVDGVFNEALAKAKDIMLRILGRPAVAVFLQATGERVSAHNARSLKRRTGIDFDAASDSSLPVVEEWVRTNTALIKTIPDKALRQVQDAISRGLGPEELAAEISRISDVTERRARLIAKDQTQKLEGLVNEARQKALGVEEYVWISRQDSKVRPQHRKQHGQTFKWNDPPLGGHPGSPVNCRCVAAPVFK